MHNNTDFQGDFMLYLGFVGFIIIFEVKMSVLFPTKMSLPNRICEKTLPRE